MVVVHLYPGGARSDRGAHDREGVSCVSSQRWSAQTDHVVRAAGWWPARSVRTETWEAVLGERGAFVVHEATRRFLAEFGGLVTYGWPADSAVTQSAVRFDPLADGWDGGDVCQAE